MKRDSAKEVRAGEELDAAVVDAWLKSQVEDLEGDLEVKQFPSGNSNLTYALNYPSRAFVLRRPPFGTKAKSAHDMGREVTVLRGLAGRYPVPEVIAHCASDDVIGAEFYVMDRVQGVILRKDMPPDVDQGTTRDICRAVLEAHVALHQLEVPEGLHALAKEGSYVKRQIKGWAKRYERARTPDAASFAATVDWLEAERPDDVGACVIHNDFRFDNVVLNELNLSEIVGVLDWEMCTIGDPLMDLGSSLAYWVQDDDDDTYQMMRLQPTNAPGMFTRDEVIATYGELTGRDMSNFDYYLVYGIFRLAVILQQIYYRYHHGQTRDERFAPFGAIASYLETRCLGLQR